MPALFFQSADKPAFLGQFDNAFLGQLSKIRRCHLCKDDIYILCLCQIRKDGKVGFAMIFTLLALAATVAACVVEWKADSLSSVLWSFAVFLLWLKVAVLTHQLEKRKHEN